MDNVEEVITIEMHYIADADGYLQAVSFGATIACDGVSCVEYVGTVPDGYASLEAWYAAECEQLHKWKVVDYNLVKDDNAPDPVKSATRLRTTEDGRGNLQLYNADGGLAVNAYATDKGIGEVDAHGADGVARATIFVTAPTSETPNEGRLVLKNAAGDAAHLGYDDIEKLKNMAISGPGTVFIPDETLTLRDGVLSVNTANTAEADNTLPITSAAVHTTVGNIEILLGTI